MNTGQITDPTIQLKPSKKLFNYVRALKVTSNIPLGITNIIFKNRVRNNAEKRTDCKYLITDSDRQFIKSLKLNSNVDLSQLNLTEETTASDSDKLLNLQDLHWLYNHLQLENKDKLEKTYLHELLEGSAIILPKNSEIPRNPELEKRCERLRASQQNREYSDMTKNVNVNRRRHPEDTIAYQMQQMNRHLIAIAQFIMSVLAGFAFGFIGVELLIGNLDFGFRLLLGIICALIIALAELYFLAKKLNEDLKFETTAEMKKKGTKLD